MEMNALTPADGEATTGTRPPRSFSSMSLVAAVVALLLGAFVVVGPASSSTAQAGNGVWVEGRVQCYSPVPHVGDDVVGIWVDAKNGGDRWASFRHWRSSKSFANFWFYLPNGGDYKLHIGCGGTPARWQTSQKTHWLRTTKARNTCVMWAVTCSTYQYGRRT